MDLRSLKIYFLIFLSLSCSSVLFAQLPSTPAPDPTCPASDVISLFSDTYTDVPMSTFITPWSPPPSSLSNLVIAGNNYKRYTGVSFIGIESTGPIDASSMSAFHFTMWTPNMTTFRVKLVDFGANGVFGGGDDSEHEVNIYNPDLSTWKTYNLFMFDFPTLSSTSNISQVLFSGDPYGSSIFCLDNMYFSNCPNQLLPPIAAPTPTHPSSNVISIYSDAYSDVTVDSFLAAWSIAPASVADISVAGNATKCYQGVTNLGIEFTGANLLDLSSMTHLHMDVWTPNMQSFRIKLVDLGANGIFGGGDDSEHELTFDNFTQTSWVSGNIPLSTFTGLNSTSNIAQIIISGAPESSSRFYMDNLYFYNLDPPLPVELISFTAEKTEQEHVHLKWATASEVNSDKYIIERSADGQIFESIGHISSMGNSSTIIHYEFLDRTPLKPNNYYRLKQVDFDGTFEYLGVRHVLFQDLEIKIVPNPAIDHIRITGPEEAKIEVSILDINGSILLREQKVESIENFVYVGDLKPSMYLVQIKMDDQITFEKLIIQ